MRILLVEDDDFLVEALVDHFQHWRPSYRVSVVGTAVEAKDLLQIGKIDVLITDNSFPAVHECGPPEPFGLELLELARERGIPAVLISGDWQVVAEAQRRGFPAFLKGNLPMDEIESTLENLFWRRECVEE